MKIISWNCNGAFREKYDTIIRKDADIYIIQECENPRLSKHKEYIDWADNYLWVGDNKNKGLGIFASKTIDLKPLDWSNQFNGYPVKYFLPCIINDNIQLLGVWTHYNNSPTFGYIGQLWKYIETNKSYFKNIIIAGDFNSNSIWDKWDRWWNHSDVVKELNNIGINSLYHNLMKEKHGKETIPTFFLHRKKEKPYHIDYCFASDSLNPQFNSIEIDNFSNWNHLSDHTPLTVTLK